jgi:hypothetical protein
MPDQVSNLSITRHWLVAHPDEGAARRIVITTPEGVESWQRLGYKVDGPFVRADAYRGAVEALGAATTHGQCAEGHPWSEGFVIGCESCEPVRVLANRVGGQSEPAREPIPQPETVEEAESRFLRGAHAFGPHPGTAEHRAGRES